METLLRALFGLSHTFLTGSTDAIFLAARSEETNCSRGFAGELKSRAILACSMMGFTPVGVECCEPECIGMSLVCLKFAGEC